MARGKQVGPPFRSASRSHERLKKGPSASGALFVYSSEYQAVFLCSCGEHYASRVKRHSRIGSIHKGCLQCTGGYKTYKPVATTGWQTVLRERIVRLQNWFSDRCGNRKCADCGRRRYSRMATKGSPIDEKDSKLCRECQANRQAVTVTTITNRVFPPTRNNWKDDTNEVFDNVCRLLEDRSASDEFDDYLTRPS